MNIEIAKIFCIDDCAWKFLNQVSKVYSLMQFPSECYASKK